MKKVKVSELKARLSQHLRAVQGGQTLTIMDRTTPIARLVPFEPETGIIVRSGKGDFRKVELPPPVKTKHDIVGDLLRDRERDRG